MGIGPDRDGSPWVVEGDRMDGGGDAGYVFMLRVLGRNSSFRPESVVELNGCNSGDFLLPVISLDIVLVGKTQHDRLAGGVMMPEMLLDGADEL